MTLLQQAKHPPRTLVNSLPEGHDPNAPKHLAPFLPLPPSLPLTPLIPFPCALFNSRVKTAQTQPLCLLLLPHSPLLHSKPSNAKSFRISHSCTLSQNTRDRVPPQQTLFLSFTSGFSSGRLSLLRHSPRGACPDSLGAASASLRYPCPRGFSGSLSSTFNFRLLAQRAVREGLTSLSVASVPLWQIFSYGFPQC